MKSAPKIKSILDLLDILPENERIIVDILREVVLEHLPEYCKEKLSYNVPYYCGKKGICIIWPASIPRGGIKEGVLLGFWQGYMLKDELHYLERGTNKKIYYKIYESPDQIDLYAISTLLTEAIALDLSF